MKDDLPQESKSQEIGYNARLALDAARPRNWRLHPLDGDDDVGIDFQVQLLMSHQYQYIFRMQLKGTESPSFSTSGDFLSISFKTSTLNYYERIIEPVLIVVSDLSIDDEPSKCPTYFVWAHDEIVRLKTINQFDANSQTTTIRVPVANILTTKLDITPYLENCLQLHNAANVFDRAVENKMPEYQPEQRSQLLEKIAREYKGGGLEFIESISIPRSETWNKVDKKSFAGRLSSIEQYLNRGDDDFAAKIFEELEPLLPNTSLLEKAEFWYLKGRYHALNSQELESIEAYELALAQNPDSSKYLLTLVEMKLARDLTQKSWDPSALLSKLTSDKPEIVAVAARVLAASGQYDEAKKKLATLDSKDAIDQRAIIATACGDTNLAVTLCNEGLADSYLEEHIKRLLLLLRSRAYFSKALNLEAGKVGYVIPTQGPPQIDFEMLYRAWEDIQAVVELMRVAGWPRNVEYLADIWGAVVVIIGRHQDALNDILDAARKRPTIQRLQECLEQVAAKCERHDLVMESLERQEPGSERTFKKIAVLHQSHEYGKCVDLLKNEMGRLPTDHPMFPICLVSALLSADLIMKEDVAEEFYTMLCSNSKWADQVPVADYYRSIGRDVLQKDKALAKLEDAYTKFKDSINVAITLFDALDACNPEQAKKCISISQKLRAHSQFDLENTLHLSQAYATLSDWKSLLILADESAAKFGLTGRLRAIRALALDKCGRTPDAIQELRDLVAGGISDKIAINTYINIVTRCGFTDEATKLVEKLIEQNLDKRKKLDYLQLLFGLVHQSDPKRQRCENIAWRIGQIVDQKEEAEEGLFLIIYITATLPEEVIVSEDRKVELQNRLSKFTERFPTSKILRFASVPQEPSIYDFKKMVTEVTGQTPEIQAWQEKMLQGLIHDTIPIPFAWRPHRVLVNIPDIAALWETAKISKRDASQYHLTMASNEWKPVEFRKMDQQLPILDLTALFIINDLDLFDILFSLFPYIAISQTTLIELQNLARPLFGSFAQKRCVEVVKSLQKYFNFIYQPAPIEQCKEGINDDKKIDAIKELVKSGKYMLYSDDLLYRIFAQVPESAPSSICTMDILYAAEERGLLTTEQVAEHISRLVEWNVVTRFSFRYVVALIPESISRANSIDKAVSILQSDRTSNILFEALWSIRKPYQDFIVDAGNMLAFLVREPKNEAHVVAAIWGIWYIKAKLRGEKGIMPAFRHAILIMLKAITVLPDEDTKVYQLLWKSFLYLIPLEFVDRMDEQKEREMIKLAGQETADLDISSNKNVEFLLKERLLMGLTKDIEEYDIFLKAYSDRIIWHELRNKNQ